MPQTTPEIKVEAVRELGAEVVFAGDTYSDAQAHAEALAARGGLVFVHPFDDPLVIAGQGTIGEEIVRQSHGRVAAVFVPVGGGGLLAGIAGYVKALFPQTLVFGVEPYESDALYRSLAAGRRVRLDHVGIFADGVAVREVGALPFEMAQATVDGVIRVDERRDLRRHQGRVRRHAQRDGAGGGAVGRRPEELGRARGRPRPGRSPPCSRAPTPTSTGCASWPSAPSSARRARRSSASPSRSGRAPSASSAP